MNPADEQDLKRLRSQENEVQKRKHELIWGETFDPSKVLDKGQPILHAMDLFEQHYKICLELSHNIKHLVEMIDSGSTVEQVRQQIVDWEIERRLKLIGSFKGSSSGWTEFNPKTGQMEPMKINPYENKI